MGEFEDMLNSILSSPNEMEKIMDIAKEPTQGGDAPRETEAAPKAEPKPEAIPNLGDISPKMLGAIGKVMGELKHGGDDKAALVNSMKPYLKPQRRETLDKAVKIARVARVARTAISEFGGDLDLGL